MMPLYVPSMATVSLIVIARQNANDAISAFPNGEPSGSVTSRRRGRPWSTGPGGSRSRLSSRIQSTSWSRLVQITPKRPPSRSTRAISGTARSGSIQCHADEMNTPSALASGSGMASPRPCITSMAGSRARSTAAIRSSGSTAMTRGAPRASARDSSPVPAPRSMTTLGAAGSSHSTAASGGPDRSRSYSAAIVPNDIERSARLATPVTLACRRCEASQWS